MIYGLSFLEESFVVVDVEALSDLSPGWPGSLLSVI